MAVAATATMKMTTEEGGNFFTRMAWYYQMLILLVLTGGLIYAADSMLYSDTRADTSKIEQEVEKLKVKNAQASIIKQNLKAAEETLAQKKTEMDGLRDLLPDQVEITNVYNSIKDLMKAQKLELKKFMPQKEVAAEIYTEQPIQIEITGSYDNLGIFLSQLGFYRRIVSVTNVDIKQAEDNAQMVGRSINAAFTVSAYYISANNQAKLNGQAPPSTGAPATPNNAPNNAPKPNSAAPQAGK
jgi:type IV pilus assembly protein PilO